MNQADQKPPWSGPLANRSGLFKLSLVIGSLLLMGGLGWIVKGGAFNPQDQGLMKSYASKGKDVPQPPSKPVWVSPLQNTCSGQDLGQHQYLQRLLDALRTNPTRVRVDPTNVGERFHRDAFGNAVDPTPRLVVLHETVYGMSSAIHTFRTAHPDDADQVSYHALIGEDGTVVQLIDPSKRAFGAGNSAFNGQWVVTNPKVGGSVNNFALHVSLETPLDGENDNPGHSGYSSAQYDALAALLADWMGRYPISFENITTHRAVDLGGERSDPRSFNWQALQERLQNLGLLCKTN